MKADIQKILLTGEDRPDLYSVHKLQNVAPLNKPQIVAEFYGRPINYHSDDGLVACDTLIRPISELTVPSFEFEYGCEKTNFIARYNDITNIENNTLASFEIRDNQGLTHWINYKLFGATPTANVIEGNKIKYTDVMPDIDLEYVTDTWRLKENIIIKAPKQNYSYLFTIKLDTNTVMEQQLDGFIFFKDVTTNEVVYRIEKPYAIDSGGRRTENVRYILGKQIYNGIEYDSVEVVIEDTEFINAAAFPVTIDPTTVNYNSGASANDGFAYRYNAGYPTTAQGVNTTSSNLETEKSYDGNYNVCIWVQRFNTSSVPDDAIIQSSSMTVKCIVRANSNLRNLNCEYYDFTTIDTSCFTMDVGDTAFAKAISSINDGNSYTIPLSNVININKMGYTGFRTGISGSIPTGDNRVYISSFDSTTVADRPVLAITYNIPPPVPSLIVPNGGETYNASCNIAWSASSDADGDAITYDIDYSPNNGTNWYDIASGVIGTSYTWNTSALTAGSTYLMRIRAYDGTSYSAFDQSNGVFTIQHITDEVNIGGIWKEVDSRYCNIDGVWKDIDAIFCNIGGVWKSS